MIFHPIFTKIQEFFLGKNTLNLRAYNSGITNYIQKSPEKVEGNKKLWIDTGLSLIKKTSPIFEIGSGPGIDADYMEHQGYSVVRSDASKGFLEYQKSLGKNIIFYDISAPTQISQTFSLVHCNLVIQHFPKSELKNCIKNISLLLKQNGFLSIGIKLGIGEGWEYSKLKHPRYFSYREENEFVCEMETLGYKKIFSIIKDEIYFNSIFQKI